MNGEEGEINAKAELGTATKLTNVVHPTDDQIAEGVPLTQAENAKKEKRNKWAKIGAAISITIAIVVVILIVALQRRRRRGLPDETENYFIKQNRRIGLIELQPKEKHDFTLIWLHGSQGSAMS